MYSISEYFIDQLYDPSPPDIDSSIIMYVHGVEMISIREDGFYIYGNKVSDNTEVYEGFVNFLKDAGY